MHLDRGGKRNVEFKLKVGSIMGTGTAERDTHRLQPIRGRLKKPAGDERPPELNLRGLAG